MRSLKTQYFLTYAVLGNLLPFLPVYLAARGLTRPQIGQVLAAGSFAILVTPTLVGFLADTHVNPRRLMAVLCLLAGSAVAVLYFVSGFWPILALYALHNLAFIPFISLQDGMNFSLQRDLLRCGQAIEPYHRVRVWGTIGFILPSGVLFLLLHADFSLGVILFSAAACCTLGLINTFRLPEGCRPVREPLLSEPVTSGTASEACPHAQSAVSSIAHDPRNPRNPRNTADCAIRIAPLAVPLEPPAPEPPQPPAILESPPSSPQRPALAALRVMLEPHLLVYCIGMFLANMAMYAYYTYYPIYLTDQAHIGQQWVGLIANLGVVGEIFYMTGFGWLDSGTLGFKRLLAIGIAGVVLRMLLVGLSTSWLVAIGTQVLHGMMVLVIQVMPPVYLNRSAQDSNRNSMQALYAMLVNGSGRIAGSLAGGMIAGRTGNLSAVFFAAAGSAGLAGGLFAFAFHEKAAIEQKSSRQ